MIFENQRTQEQVRQQWMTIWGLYKETRRRLKHTGGGDGDEADDLSEFDGGEAEGTEDQSESENGEAEGPTSNAKDTEKKRDAGKSNVSEKSKKREEGRNRRPSKSAMELFAQSELYEMIDRVYVIYYLLGIYY